MKTAFPLVLLLAMLCACQREAHNSIAAKEPVPVLRSEISLEATPFALATVEGDKLKIQTKGNWVSGDRVIRSSDFLYLEPNKQIPLYERHIGLQLLYIPPSELLIYSRFSAASLGRDDEVTISLLKIENEK